jgi:hypothetical protein
LVVAQLGICLWPGVFVALMALGALLVTAVVANDVLP